MMSASLKRKNLSSPALGQGWRLGFLGLLHMEVFNQRLEQEFGAEVIVTVPTVPYKSECHYWSIACPLRPDFSLMDSSAVRIMGEKNIKKYGSNVITITTPALFPDPTIVEEYLEPMVLGTIITPGNI